MAVHAINVEAIPCCGKQSHAACRNFPIDASPCACARSGSARRASLSAEVQSAIAARLADDRRQEAILAALIESGELWRLAR